MENQPLKVFKIIIACLPLLLVFWIIDQRFTPTGTRTFNTDLKNESRFISPLYPEDAVSAKIKENGNTYQKILSNFTYFDIFVYRPFQKIKTSITFRTDDQEIVELGPNITEGEWAYNFTPLFNAKIESLDWPIISDGKTKLWQRKKSYDSLAQFAGQYPSPEQKVAVYNYDEFISNFRLPNYQAEPEKLVLKEILRGSHTIYTYLKNENLDFKIAKSDLNRYAGSDELRVRVLHNNREIYAKIIEDDGLIVESGVGGEIQSGQINLDKETLSEGVYQIILEASDDVLIRQIETTQHLFVFANNLFLAENPEYLKLPARASYENSVYGIFYPDFAKTTVKIPHPDSAQIIKLNSRELELSEAERNYELDQYLKNGEINTITAPLNDLKLSGFGFLAFSPDNFFSPLPDNLIALKKDTNLEEIDFVIANYQAPEKLADNWLKQSLEFDLSATKLNPKRELQFALYAPRLSENERTLEISEIQIDLIKNPLTIDNFYPRLKNYLINLFP